MKWNDQTYVTCCLLLEAVAKLLLSAASVVLLLRVGCLQSRLLSLLRAEMVVDVILLRDQSLIVRGTGYSEITKKSAKPH